MNGRLGSSRWSRQRRGASSEGLDAGHAFPTPDAYHSGREVFWRAYTMPGRPQTMKRKVAGLEDAILEVYRHLDAATPKTHKDAAGNRSTAPASPWVRLFRAGSQFLLAGVDLGNHYRPTTGDTEPGPIQESLGEDGLRRIRAQAATGDSAANGANGKGPSQLDPVLRGAMERLPNQAAIQSEVVWVAANLHDPQPDYDKAPSRTAINLLRDVARDERLRREFWTIQLAKRLSPGESRRKATAFPEDRDERIDQEEEERTARLMEEMFPSGAYGNPNDDASMSQE